MVKVGKSGDQAKTGRAFRVKDGQVYEAHELKSLPDRVTGDEFWLCAHKHCTALMDPVAWRERRRDGEPYVMPPHFTSWDINQHHPDCRLPVERETGEASYHEAEHRLGVPDDIPERVVFETNEVAEAKLLGDEAYSAESERTGQGRSVPMHDRVVPEGMRSTSQSTVRKCCKVFLECDDHHAHPLKVDGCFGADYGSVFAPLLPPRDALLAGQRILYAEVYMKGVLDRLWPGVVDGKIRLPLLATAFDNGRTIRRRLEIDVTGWKPDAAEDFVRRAREAADAGWSSYLETGLQRPWVFFVGSLVERAQLVLRVEQEAMVEVLAGKMPPHAFEDAELKLRAAHVDLRASASAEVDRAVAAAARWEAEHRRDASEPSPDTGSAKRLPEKSTPAAPIASPYIAEEPGRDGGEGRDGPVGSAAATEGSSTARKEGGAVGSPFEPDGEQAEPSSPNPVAAEAGADASIPAGSDIELLLPAQAETGREDGAARAAERADARPAAYQTDEGVPVRRMPTEQSGLRNVPNAVEQGSRPMRRNFADIAKDGVAQAWRWLFG